MKTKFYLALAIVAVLFFALGQAMSGKSPKLSEETQKNLSTAMHGEAFAFAKYSLYAEQARRNGNAELANLFERTARTERLEHFAEEARLAGLVGSDTDNLNDSIKGESYEVDTMYPGFAKAAAAAGDETAAKRFGEIRNDEAKHRDAFKAALKNVENATQAANQ